MMSNYAFPQPGLAVGDGGLSENILVPSYRFLIKVDKKYRLKPKELAPLTDAELTPYRAIKKVRQAVRSFQSFNLDYHTFSML
jgi:D-arabinose 1-dehydrogenase-like Zn-dependent alcohol dehydrogenase